MLISRGRWEMKEPGLRLRNVFKRGRVLLIISLIITRTPWFIHISRSSTSYQRYMILGGSNTYSRTTGLRWRLNSIRERLNLTCKAWIGRGISFAESSILQWARMRSRPPLDPMWKANGKKRFRILLRFLPRLLLSLLLLGIFSFGTWILMMLKRLRCAFVGWSHRRHLVKAPPRMSKQCSNKSSSSKSI